MSRVGGGNVPYRVSIEVVNDECRVLRLLRDSGTHQFAVIDVRRLPHGVTRHLMRLPTDSLNKVSRKPNAKVWDTIRFGGEAAAWFETDGCRVCNTIVSKGAFLVTAWNSGEDKIIYTFIAPNATAAQDIISALENFNFKLRVLGMERYRRRTLILTEKQEAALWLALEAGFFDHPKKIGIRELSQRLKVSPSTLSETIRRGIQRLLKHYFENL
ncbi:MAG: helix-turn-helix domain-containing protein [Candidatus Bathyarchaeota archaeon]|nr:helix-turn-helix domain-containing protein [Candidatus Bathyarchaeota archaeon]